MTWPILLSIAKPCNLKEEGLQEGRGLHSVCISAQSLSLAYQLKLGAHARNYPEPFEQLPSVTTFAIWLWLWLWCATCLETQSSPQAARIYSSSCFQHAHKKEAPSMYTQLDTTSFFVPPLTTHLRVRQAWRGPCAVRAWNRYWWLTGQESEVFWKGSDTCHIEWSFGLQFHRWEKTHCHHGKQAIDINYNRIMFAING